MPRRKPTWKPATTFKVIKLEPNGPKPGQPVDAYLYGRDQGYHRLLDDPNTKLGDLP
jgi:hypothetical protein